MHDIYHIQKKDASRAGAILAAAFKEDPIWKKVFEMAPGSDDKWPYVFEVPVRYCLKYGGVWAPSENLEGFAAWTKGAYSDMSMFRMLFSGALFSGLKMGATLGKLMQPVFVPMVKDRNECMRGRDYYYLFALGVDPELQGKGFGKTLLRALIAKSQQEKRPLYLETETEDNVRMYEKFGFTVHKRITLPVINVPLWEMVREPGAATGG